MGNYLKMQITDKENLCQNIYTNEIIKSAVYLKEYEQYAKIGKKIIPATCYTNFRDGLFHFRKLARCLEEHEIMQQSFAVKEHLNRARTDAKISVLFYFSGVASELLKDDSISDRIKCKLRKALHEMKHIILTSRIDGMMMSGVSVRKVEEDEVIIILQDFFDLVQEYCFEQFTEINNRTDLKSEGLLDE